MTIDELIRTLERLTNEQPGIHGGTLVQIEVTAPGGKKRELSIDGAYDTRADNGFRYVLITVEQE